MNVTLINLVFVYIAWQIKYVSRGSVLLKILPSPFIFYYPRSNFWRIFHNISIKLKPSLPPAHTCAFQRQVKEGPAPALPGTWQFREGRSTQPCCVARAVPGWWESLCRQCTNWCTNWDGGVGTGQKGLLKLCLMSNWLQNGQIWKRCKYLCLWLFLGNVLFTPP